MIVSILMECWCRTVPLRVYIAELGSYSEGSSYVRADIGEPGDGGLSNLKNTTWVRLIYALLHHLHVSSFLQHIIYGKTFLLCLNPIHALVLPIFRLVQCYPEMAGLLDFRWPSSATPTVLQILREVPTLVTSIALTSLGTKSNL